MPVATKATVKTLSTEELKEISAEVIITNALHLHIRPGEKVIERFGGIHPFMSWEGPIFSDSGGFQIIRKNFNIKKSDEGLKFRDFFNGSSRLYTPEMAMEIQKALGTDITMLLDDCPVYDAPKKKIKEATERTVLWAKKEIEYGRKLGLQNIFAIVQGGCDFELRKWCTEELKKLNPDGYGIGGLSIGESKEKMLKTLLETTSLLPEEKPRYLMGVGSVKELIECIAMGIDIFDSAFPTQCARHGTIFTASGRYNMCKAKLNEDERALDENCACKVCKNYSRAYINHLLREKEMLGMRLASYHNLYFILNLVRSAREAIVKGTFEEFRKSLNSPLQRGVSDMPLWQSAEEAEGGGV